MEQQEVVLPPSRPSEHQLQNNLKGLERFGSQDILRTVNILTQNLKQLGPKLTETTPLLHQQDLTILRQKVSAGKVENRVDLNDPDKLWLALNILYPKRIAENTYLILRSAQLKSLGANVDPTKVSAEQLHQAVLERAVTNPKILPYLNTRQMIYGNQAIVGMLQGISESFLKKHPKLSTKKKLALAAGGTMIGISSLSGYHPPTTSSEEPTAVGSTETEPQKNTLVELVTLPLLKKVEANRQDKEWVDKELNKGGISVLIIGQGLEDYAQYADATIMARFIPKQNRFVFISLHRDTYAPEITPYAVKKGQPPSRYELMRALEFGGRSLVQEIAEKTTALSADYYLKFTIDGVIQFIDKVFGKVKINVPQDIPDDGSGFSFKKGEQYMDGKLTQYYMRSRQTTSVERRSTAQQQVIEAMMDEVFNRIKNGTREERQTLLEKVKEVFITLQRTGKIQTNFSVTQFIDIINTGLNNPATQLVEAVAGKDQVFKKPTVTKLVLSDFVDVGKIPRNTGPRDALRAYLDPKTGKLIIPESDSNLVETYYALPRAKTRQVLLSETISAEQKVIPQVNLKQTPELKFPGSSGIVDSNSPIHWDGNTAYAFNSAPGGITRSLGPDLAHLTKDPAQPVVFDNEQLNKFTWFEATYKQGNTLYGWYHHEPPGLFPAGTNRQIRGVDWLTAPRIGAAVSKDNGRSWQDLGFIIDSPPNTFNPETANLYFVGGNGDFSVIPDEKKEYFYIFLSSYHKDLAQQGIALARMRYQDLANQNAKVWKWHQGKWEESGLGRSVSPIISTKLNVHKEEANFYWGPSVHFNTYLQNYVMLLNHSKDQNFTQEGVYVSFNPDISNPANWSEPKRINYTPKNPKDWYPQVVGQGKGETDKRVGQTARLFVKGESNFEIVFLKPGETLP